MAISSAERARFHTATSSIKPVNHELGLERNRPPMAVVLALKGRTGVITTGIEHAVHPQLGLHGAIADVPLHIDDVVPVHEVERFWRSSSDGRRQSCLRCS
jgi:hypothetical protein